jgi:hypothetical protein
MTNGNRLTGLRHVAHAFIGGITLLAASTAAASTPIWWFQSPTFRIGIRPVSGVPSIVGSVKLHGRTYTGVGFIGHFGDGTDFYPKRVCTVLLEGNRTNHVSGSCGAVTAKTGKSKNWIGYQDSTGLPIALGYAQNGVAKLSAELETGSKTHTMNVPLTTISAVGGGRHFFIFTHPAEKIFAFDAYSNSGKLLEHLLENPPKPKR